MYLKCDECVCNKSFPLISMSSSGVLGTIVDVWGTFRIELSSAILGGGFKYMRENVYTEVTKHEYLNKMILCVVLQ